MIDLKTIVKREFWHGISVKIVKQRIKEINKQISELDKYDYDLKRILNVDKELIDQIKRVLNDEIELCNFYLEFNGKKIKHDWTFLKAKEREERGEQDWQVRGRDCWIKTNGRIRIKINIDRSGLMTKISMDMENDSKSLTFYERPYGMKEIYTHKKNKESIENQIREYKIEAEKLFMKHKYPNYCFETRQMDQLNQLLHIN